MAVMVGREAPSFRGSAVKGGSAELLNTENAFVDLSLDDFRGRWLVLFFYPSDFSVVCPTELLAFGRHYDSFAELGADVLAISTDSKHSHLAWRRQESSLRVLPYMMVADSSRQISRDFGVLVEDEGTALRGTFIIDPQGVVQYMVVHNEDVGRSVEETRRVLNALQTHAPCPCNWKPGEPTLTRVEAALALD